MALGSGWCLIVELPVAPCKEFDVGLACAHDQMVHDFEVVGTERDGIKVDWRDIDFRPRAELYICFAVKIC
jgi:hypothetical protein